MIVKNEESRLRRCLTSILPFVSEAIVVDTGSTDGTVSLARSLGARVEERPWRDDFSWARNQSLDLATRTWVLVADADDVLRVTDETAFAAALQQTDVDAFAVDYHDQLDGGGVQIIPVMRLFRRDRPHMRFAGEVHEQLVAVARGLAPLGRAHFLHLDHDGHLGAVMAERQTLARNLALAEAMVARDPHQAFSWFCLGQSLLAFGESKHREAVVAYQRSWDELGRAEAVTDEAYAVSLHLNLARALHQDGEQDAALRVLDRGLALFAASPDLHLLRGQWLMARQRWSDAEADFLACLQPDAATFFVREQAGATGFLARTQLGLLALRRGEVAAAEPLLKAAVDEAPLSDLLPRLLLASTLSARGAHQDVLTLMAPARAAYPNNADVRMRWERAQAALQTKSSEPR